jgi:hypothetical protein
VPVLVLSVDDVDFEKIINSKEAGVNRCKSRDGVWRDLELTVTKGLTGEGRLAIDETSITQKGPHFRNGREPEDKKERPREGRSHVNPGRED